MYIHEHNDWWNFRYDEGNIMCLLSSVRAKQGRIMGRLEALGFNVRNTTTLDNLSLDIIKSSEIEGELLNPEQVRSSVARRLGMDTAGLAESSHYIDGVVSMMLDATMNCNEPLSEERLADWHRILFPYGKSGLYKIDVGCYRLHPMQVVSGAMGRERVHYEAPAPEFVSDEMKRLIDYVNNEDTVEPIVKAAIVHLWFVTIHPFDDGNGRMARALTDMLLARSDSGEYRFYSMSNAINAHRRRYYEILESVQHGDGDITEWLRWFLEMLDESLDCTDETISSALRKSKYWEANVNVVINERQRKILNILLDGFDGLMTTGRWSRICHCSRDTALSDANDLLAKGLLRLGPARGRSTHYLLPL